jgi:signal peptidase I
MARNRRSLRSEVFALGVTALLVTAARSSLADHYYVPSGSMEFSLLPGDRVIVDKTAYGLRIPLTKIDILAVHAPARGDIAVFDSPYDGKRLIKRIVAVGGDRVDLIDGHLSVNDKPLEQGPFERFETRRARLNLDDGGGPDINALTIPEGMVLALGDHRGDSFDGRFFGLIQERDLYGRALVIYYRKSDGFTWQSL